MKEEISLFVQEKGLSSHSVQAYTYDLRQFMEVIDGLVTTSKLEIYQAFLQGLSPAAQQRKVSAVNQFLYFLYEKGRIGQFYKLKSRRSPKLQESRNLADLSPLREETVYTAGQAIALLITELGLIPSEIAQLSWADLELDFQVLTIHREGKKRVLSFEASLLSYLPEQKGPFLFDKKGQPYSRQWFFNRLSEFTASLGHREWTAQKLREQYILHQLQAGKSMGEVAKNLGLKSALSLEKYREYGY